MVQRSFQTATKFFKTSEIIPKPSSFSALNSFKIYAVIIIMLLLHATIISKPSDFSNWISSRIPIRIETITIN